MKKAWIILIAISVLLIVAIFMTFIYTKNCTNSGCFYSSMAGCDRAKYIDETSEASWLYSIKGKSGGLLCPFSNKFCDSCRVNVKLLQLKQGKIDATTINGLDMTCSLAISFVGNPQTDISKCHGKLKEKMQELIIQKMYSEIAANIGQVKTDINKAF